MDVGLIRNFVVSLVISYSFRTCVGVSYEPLHVEISSLRHEHDLFLNNEPEASDWFGWLGSRVSTYRVIHTKIMHSWYFILYNHNHKWMLDSLFTHFVIQTLFVKFCFPTCFWPIFMYNEHIWLEYQHS